MTSPDLFGYLLKIVLSIILGGLIGVEREISHHWAGLRTHILVSLGSTLFMFITSYEYVNPQLGVNINLDVTRLAAGVITGIGFLGAGVIFREGVGVKGLTTAASIWVTASVGLLIGIGKYELALIATLLILIVLYSDMVIEKKLIKSGDVKYLNITIAHKHESWERIEKMLKESLSSIHLHNFKRNKNTTMYVYRVIIQKIHREKITRMLLKDPDVVEINWTE